MVRFGVPLKLVTKNATKISSSKVVIFYYEHQISLEHSSSYCSQGNGQAEYTNKNLVSIMKIIVDENQKNWHKKLYEYLWEDRNTPKREIEMLDFELVYGIGSIFLFPLEFLASKCYTVI